MKYEPRTARLAMTAIMTSKRVLGRHERKALAITILLLAALASASCSKKGDTVDSHLSRANEYFASQQYDKAEKEYREVLRAASKNPVAIRQLGVIYHDQGQVLQALPLLKKAMELEPDNLEVQLKLGQTYLWSNEIKEARNAAMRVLDKQPANDEALVLLADTGISTNDIDEVQKLLEGLRDKDQNLPAYHLAWGQLALKEKDLSRAENEFKAAIDSDPKFAAAHLALGTLYWANNDLQSAAKEFKTAADLSPPRSLMRVQYANFLLKTGARAEAKSVLEDITRIVPDYLPARDALLKIICTEHRGDDCAARVQSILAQDPSNYDALFEDGILSGSKGELAKSIREFEYLSKTYRQNPQVSYQLALANMLYAAKTEPPERDRVIENAEHQLIDTVKLAPHFADATILLSELKIQKGVPAAAVVLLKPLTEEQPQIAGAQYLLASAYLAQQQVDQALAVYRRMEELFPKDPKPPFLGGTILLAQRQPAEARKAFEKSLEISPEFLSAAERLVDLDLADRRYDTAIDRAQKFIDRNPKQAQAWALMGKIYLAQQDFTRAEQDLLKATELDPNLESAYLLLAKLYVDTNQQARAIDKLTAFVDKNKDNGQSIAPALLRLAFIQQNLKHFNEARDAYEKLLASSPNFVPALNNLAVLYSDNLGQLDKAYDLAKRARDNAPIDPHVAGTLGWILDKKGDYGAAIPLLQESAGKLPREPDIQFQLGMAQYMLGAEDPARLALQQAVDIGTDFPDKEEARRRLGLLAINAEVGQTADVRNALETYLHEQPDDPVARLRLGELEEREGAVDQAVKTYQKIIDGDQHFAPALRRLALLYSQRPSEDASFYDLATKARQAYPEDPDLTRVLGILSYERGFYPQSAELLKEATIKQSNNAEVFYYLGLASHQLQQWSECDSALKRAMNLDLSPKFAGEAKPALVDCSAQLEKAEGVQRYRSGDYQQSARLLKEAATNRKDDPELLYYLGQAYHQLRQLSECKETLQHALNLDLAPALANDAKHALPDCSEGSLQ